MKLLNKQKLEEMHLIIDQILVCKILLFFTKTVLQIHITSQLLMLLLHQIILHALEIIF